MAIKLSNSLSEEFCIKAAKEAVTKYGAPEIVHTDKGKQFVGKEFTEFFQRLRDQTKTGENHIRH